jgi:uncharacterized membrane protein
MSIKQYQRIKFISTFILAFICAQSIVFKNYFIPILILAVTSLLLTYLKSKVKEVVADERDYAIGGKSALLAIQVYSWISVVCMFIFYAFSETNPVYEAIAMTLAFSVCILMLLYSFIFRYYNKISFSDNKKVYFLFLSVLIIFIAIFGIRFFSGEDSWICVDGQWVKHGNPNAPVPQYNCGESGRNEDVSWQNIVGVINNCEVRSLMRTHARNVSVVLKDGRKLSAIENEIDEIMPIVVNSKEKCGDILIEIE